MCYLQRDISLWEGCLNLVFWIWDHPFLVLYVCFASGFMQVHFSFARMVILAFLFVGGEKYFVGWCDVTCKKVSILLSKDLWITTVVSAIVIMHDIFGSENFQRTKTKLRSLIPNFSKHQNSEILWYLFWN